MTDNIYIHINTNSNTQLWTPFSFHFHQNNSQTQTPTNHRSLAATEKKNYRSPHRYLLLLNSHFDSCYTLANQSPNSHITINRPIKACAHKNCRLFSLSQNFDFTPLRKKTQKKTGEGGVWTYIYCSQTGIVKLPKHNLLAQSKTKTTQIKHSIEQQVK